MGLFNLFGNSKKDPDESVLIQLHKANSNLSKPHNIEFFIYFPTKSTAEEFAAQIEAKGFQVEVKSAAKGNEWLCFATKNLIPELETLQEIRIHFDKLAESLGGEYDGWGTEIES